MPKVIREKPIVFRIPKKKVELKKAYDKAVSKSTPTAVIIASLETNLLKTKTK